MRGPNIMAGYLRADGGVEPRPRAAGTTPATWSPITDDDWITIQGRVKRFAKIGGEMVSLTAAEDLASAVWPDGRHAVVAMPDPKKGERLVLVTDRQRRRRRRRCWPTPRASARRSWRCRARSSRSQEMPVLGTGKTDYVAIQRMADTEMPPARLAET